MQLADQYPDGFITGNDCGDVRPLHTRKYSKCPTNKRYRSFLIACPCIYRIDLILHSKTIECSPFDGAIPADADANQTLQRLCGFLVLEKRTDLC